MGILLLSSSSTRTASCTSTTSLALVLIFPAGCKIDVQYDNYCDSNHTRIRQQPLTQPLPASLPLPVLLEYRTTRQQHKNNSIVTCT